MSSLNCRDAKPGLGSLSSAMIPPEPKTKAAATYHRRAASAPAHTLASSVTTVPRTTTTNHAAGKGYRTGHYSLAPRPSPSSSSSSSSSSPRWADGDGSDDVGPVVVGLLVHGCHLDAEGWRHIVWGEPPELLGRLPHAALLAWRERSRLAKVVCGTGASSTPEGKLESEVTVDFLWENFAKLAEFDDLKHVPLDELEELLRSTIVVDTVSQNTFEEVTIGLGHMAASGVTRTVLVSSPTHLPRCLACAAGVMETLKAENNGVASRVVSKVLPYAGTIWASPSLTSYAGHCAGDVVVVEPPHRGDRDMALDALPFHEVRA